MTFIIAKIYAVFYFVLFFLKQASINSKSRLAAEAKPEFTRSK